METQYVTPPILGTTTNNNASAGYVGELINSIVAAGSATSITSAVPLNATSISLTAGDWDISGVVGFIPAATTSITQLAAGINTVSATLPAAGDGGLSQLSLATEVSINPVIMPVGSVRLSLAATTTVFLVAAATFSISTMTQYGGIRARRIR